MRHYPFWSYLWGIEISASSFLWLPSSLFWSYLWGIEIFNKDDLCVPPPFVLILPMRDWNFRLEMRLSPRRLFWSYLWGIEMLLPPRLRQALDTFWSYLWGIEIIAHRGFVVPSSKFWSYLWGIEIYLGGFNRVGDERVLILPMRDWNLGVFHTICPLCLLVLILPMRDWN